MRISNVLLKKTDESGFTLLEILVAVAIFALVSIVCYKQIDANFRTSTRIEQKYLALWIAESKLDEFFMERKWPSLGEEKSDYEILNARWIIKTNVSESEIKTLRKVEVSVYADEKSTDNAILTLVRFIGEN